MGISINGTDISAYGAKLINYSVSGIPYSAHFVKAPQMAFPITFKGSAGLREIGLQLDFIATDAATAETNISSFVAACMAGCDLLLPDGYYYNCVFGAEEASKHVAPYISQLNIKLFGVRHGALVTSSAMTAETTLAVTGNRQTPARVTISNISADCSVTINGTEIDISDTTGTVIIDGINCTVTNSGVNVFGKTNLTKFPVLNAGNNVIDMTNGLSVIIEYYPLFV